MHKIAFFLLLLLAVAQAEVCDISFPTNQTTTTKQVSIEFRNLGVSPCYVSLISSKTALNMPMNFTIQPQGLYVASFILINQTDTLVTISTSPNGLSYAHSGDILVHFVSQSSEIFWFLWELAVFITVMSIAYTRFIREWKNKTDRVEWSLRLLAVTIVLGLVYLWGSSQGW